MAGRIPQSFINDLIDRLDIVDVVERRMTLKKTGKNYSGLCPFHDEKTPSFSVSPDKQFFHCFGCQESGTALSFVMKFDRLEFVEAVEQIAGDLGLEVLREKSVGFSKPKDPGLYDILQRAERYFRHSLRDAVPAVQYLKERGLTGEVARDFGIGYAPDGWQNLEENLDGVTEQQLLNAGLAITNDSGRTYDRFRDRVMFPIRDTRGRVIGFGGRTLVSGDGPKYLNSPETEVFHKGNELYGLYEARKALRRIDRLIVVEGYMDVVALAQFGIANVVATLGTASGTPHFQKLYRYSDEVVCCFDGDQAGRQAAWKALENALPTLNEHRQLKFVFLDEGQDPDSLIREQGQEAFAKLVANAQGAMDLLFKRLGSGLDLASIDGQARFAGLAAPFVAKLPDGVLRTLVEQRVAETVGLKRPLAMGQQRRSVSLQLNAGLDKISERLLTLLLKYPQFWRALDEKSRQGLLDVTGPESVFGEILRYVERNPDVDTEELLIRFGDDARWDQPLTSMAEKQLEMGREALLLEFPEICALYVRNLRAQERKSNLQNLKASPNIDGLRRFWADRER